MTIANVQCDPCNRGFSLGAGKTHRNSGIGWGWQRCEKYRYDFKRKKWVRKTVEWLRRISRKSS